TTVLTGSGDETARLWDLEGKLLATLQEQDTIDSVIFSFDGKTVLTLQSTYAYDELETTVHLWSLEYLPEWTTTVMNPIEAYFMCTASQTGALFDIFENTFEYEIFMGMPSYVQDYIEKWYYEHHYPPSSSVFLYANKMGVFREELLKVQAKLREISILPSEDTDFRKTVLLDSCTKLLNLQTALLSLESKNSNESEFPSSSESYYDDY
ncbi:hypothetical protein H0W26_02365, partial [Candidatus Dependentiae bacterium]|nr:hypothetical protein [Candidatus Dependentiae bacterium]